LSVSSYLFGFQGRVSRSKMWLFAIVGGFLFFFTVHILFDIVFHLRIAQAQAHHQSANLTALTQAIAPLILIIALFVLFPVFTVSSLAVMTKRLHDRNKGAVWLIPFWAAPASLFPLLAYAAVANTSSTLPHLDVDSFWMQIFMCVISALMIWGFVELYCLPGTKGQNRFGPDSRPSN